MKAMILAAGLGTRLRPLTDSLPKALVEINGRTLLEITISRLRSFGVTEVIINVHHFADMVADYLKSKNNFGLRIELSREDDLLLDTGGGLKKAAWFFLESARPARQGTASAAQTTGQNSFRQGTALAVPKKQENLGALAPEVSSSDQTDQPFILHNVDVLSTIDLRRMLQSHVDNQALATLAVQSRVSSRLLLFDDHLQLVGRAAPGGKADNAAMEEPVIPSLPAEASEARNPGKVSAQPKSDQVEPVAPMVCHPERSEGSAFSSRSPLATRHSPLAFCGIHVISPRLLPMLTETGVFSIIDAYLRLASQGEKILAFRADEYYWRDLGKPSDLAQAALDFQQRVVE
jgi:NDP-sugar pyrophosphorylase family protein